MADKAVQRDKRKIKEKDLDHIKLEVEELENVYSFVYSGNASSAVMEMQKKT